MGHLRLLYRLHRDGIAVGGGARPHRLQARHDGGTGGDGRGRLAVRAGRAQHPLRPVPAGAVHPGQRHDLDADRHQPLYRLPGTTRERRHAHQHHGRVQQGRRGGGAAGVFQPDAGRYRQLLAHLAVGAGAGRAGNHAGGAGAAAGVSVCLHGRGVVRHHGVYPLFAPAGHPGRDRSGSGSGGAVGHRRAALSPAGAGRGGAVLLRRRRGNRRRHHWPVRP